MAKMLRIKRLIETEQVSEADRILLDEVQLREKYKPVFCEACINPKFISSYSPCTNYPYQTVIEFMNGQQTIIDIEFEEFHKMVSDCE